MLFKVATLSAIREGRVTLAFRRWTRPTVRAGGELRTAVGVLKFDALETIEPSQITATDAQHAGFDSVQDVLDSLGSRPGALYRVRFHLAGDDPRITLRQAAPSEADLAALSKRLARLPWAKDILDIIHKHPATRAVDLAEMLGVEKMPFKVNVRKLKNLGLTESLGTGYRISPRGAALLKQLKQ